MVTGASRGIGRATAIALAGRGFDVALTARTLLPGEGRDDSDAGQGTPVPGSLQETAEAVREHGVRALPLYADLLDHASLETAAARVLGDWGRVDVLVNNAIYTGPGGMIPFLDLNVEQLDTRLRANVVAQVVTIKAVLPAMLEAGGGLIVDVTSHVAVADPPAPVGNGGWGLGYAASKGAFHRIAGILAVELGPRGLLAINVDPGYVDTERQTMHAAANGLAGHYLGAPPSVPGSVIAWLATAPEAAAYNGQTVRAQKLALERDLHPDWRTAAGGEPVDRSDHRDVAEPGPNPA
jgi:NAD(P)-dependent dehydrogenase (short-subunit alcohol dehydrogenase family)